MVVVVAGGVPAVVVVVVGAVVVVVAGEVVVVVVVVVVVAEAGAVVTGAVVGVPGLVVVGGGGPIGPCFSWASAAAIIAFTIGPAMDAPDADRAWYGTATAIATTGSLAGARPIIQSVVFVLPGPAWAVPVFTAISSVFGKPTP